MPRGHQPDAHEACKGNALATVTKRYEIGELQDGVWFEPNEGRVEENGPSQLVDKAFSTSKVLGLQWSVDAKKMCDLNWADINNYEFCHSEGT